MPTHREHPVRDCWRGRQRLKTIHPGVPSRGVHRNACCSEPCERTCRVAQQPARAVHGNSKVRTVAEDFADPAGACSAGPEFNEHANTVGVCALDRGVEYRSIPRLRQQQLGAPLAGRHERPVDCIGVEARLRDRIRWPVMHGVPFGGERAKLRAVHQEVVTERRRSRPEPRNKRATVSVAAADHDVVGVMHDEQAHRIVRGVRSRRGHRLTYSRNRMQHAIATPVRGLVVTDRASRAQRTMLSREVLVVHARVGDCSKQPVRIGPCAAREQGVGLTTR